MANLVVVLRSFALLFITLVDFFGTDAATITVRNNCVETLWPAILTNAGQPQVSTTGFQLASGASRSFDVPAGWNGRVWARTRCSTITGRFACLTGDCGSGQVACRGSGGAPLATLAEFTLGSNGGQDFYDLSLADGFNVPASISTSRDGGNSCKSPKCLANVNAVCPAELQLKTPSGEVIGCKSACLTFNQSKYCCTGKFNSPDKCKPTAYSKIFEAQCPDAYSYAYDDKNSAFTCSNQPNYVITFCEEGLKSPVCKGPTQLDISKVKIL